MSNPYVLIISCGGEEDKEDRALIFYDRQKAVNFVKSEAKATYLNSGFDPNKLEMIFHSIETYLETRGVWHDGYDGTMYKIIESEVKN